MLPLWLLLYIPHADLTISPPPALVCASLFQLLLFLMGLMRIKAFWGCYSSVRLLVYPPTQNRRHDLSATSLL